jgi:hypothetical protein
VLFFLEIIIAVWLGGIVTNYMDAHAVELGSIIVTAVITEGELLLPDFD